MQIVRNSSLFHYQRSKMIKGRRGKVSGNTRKSSYSSMVNGNSTLEMLQKKYSTAGSADNTIKSQSMLTKTKTAYTKMNQAAGNIQEYLSNLMSAEDKSLFTKAEESGKTDQVVSEITKFVSDYNTMIENLYDAGGTVDNLYANQLNAAMKGMKDELKEIGISVEKNGTLKINKTVLSNTSLDKLKKIFGPDSSFGEKLMVKSQSVQANAQTNLNSLNNATYSSLLANYGNTGSRFNSQA